MSKTVSRRQRSGISLRKLTFFCFLLSAFCSLACSIPNLESPECVEARQTLREFYSYHFGSEMRFSPENLREREKFLSGDLINNLRGAPADNDRDPFTLTDDFPKTFRVGGCQVAETNSRVNFGVLLFWKNDTRSEQREIKVETIKQNDKWLINRIYENKSK